MVSGKADEAGANVGADQVLGLSVATGLGNLHLQLAATESKVHDHLAAACGSAVSRLAASSHSLGGGDARGMLLDLVPARDTQVHTALTDKGGDVGSGQENESDGKVLDQGQVQAVLAAELDVGALKEVERGLVQAALW